MEICPKALSELLLRHGKTLHKALGQNFLTDQHTLFAIRDAAQNAENILEIGAGVGWLSALLCEIANQVVTVEIDESLAPILKESVPFPNFSLVQNDILKTDFAEISSRYFKGKPFTVVGNLPYYITSEIIEKLMHNTSLFTCAIIMVQAEFADRLYAPIGSKVYRAMSVLVNYFFEIYPVCNVTSHCFMPPPNVDSRVIKLVPRTQRILPPASEDGFIRFVNNTFSKRRKQLSFIAESYGKSKAEFTALLRMLNLPEQIRGEALSPVQFATLYKTLKI